MRDDVPFPLPPNWRWSQIAEIGVLSPRNDAEDQARSSFVPMSMIASGYGAAHKHEVRPWGEIRSGYTHFAEGDVGLAKITPCFENSKSTVFRNLTGGFGSGTTELHTVRPLFVDPDYILLFLKCPHFIEAGIPIMTGTAGQKRVPIEYFAKSPFALPPLAEQHRIVARQTDGTLRQAGGGAHRAGGHARPVAAVASRGSTRPMPDLAVFRTAAVLDNLTPLTTRSDPRPSGSILNLAGAGPGRRTGERAVGDRRPARPL